MRSLGRLLWIVSVGLLGILTLGLVQRRARPRGMRDPAPSRLTYRLTRLRLSPVFRRTVSLGLPLAVLGAIAAGVLGDTERRAGIAQWTADARYAFEHHEVFMVRLMAVDGASDDLARAVRAAIPVDLPQSSFDLDLDAMRAQVAALDPVARVDLRIRPGGVLQVEVVERVPAVVWRGSEGLSLLDDTGHRVAPLAHRGDRPDLPLIAGDGAAALVPEALDIHAAAQPVAGRVRGLTRIGGRRWDLVLDGGQSILLPEAGAVQALEAAIALHQARDLLGRDVVLVDMRRPARPTVRLGADAAGSLRETRLVELGTN